MVDAEIKEFNLTVVNLVEIMNWIHGFSKKFMEQSAADFRLLKVDK